MRDSSARRTVWNRAWLSVLAVGVLCPVASARPQDSLEEVAEAVSPAIVTVSVLFEKRGSGAGGREPDVVNVVRPASGVIVDPAGLVVTNWHLVRELVGPDGQPDPEYQGLVTLTNGRQHRASVLAYDERADLALLEVRAGAQRLKALPLADPAELPAGSRVLALGFADGRAPQAFAGVLVFPSGPTRLREHELSAAETLLTDAPFHSSLDGGPLVDLAGRVLGIHNSSHVSARNENFREEEDEESKKPDESYAVIVSASAVRAAFGDYLASGGGPAAPVQGAHPSPAQAPIAAIEPALVSVWTGEGPHPEQPDPRDPHAQRPPAQLASGVAISADGLVWTAAEIFGAETRRASVRTADGQVYPAELVRARRERKVALLRVELPAGVSLAPARLADSRGALAGEFAAVVARPVARPIASVGVLSALERAGFVQVASWVHRGHLGGALVDREGRLVGIATDQPLLTGEIKSTSFLGFAAPLATLFEAFADELAAGGLAAPPADDAAGVEARRTAAARVVERTRSSLVNVLVSKAQPRPSSGFNPFDEPEPTFGLSSQGSGVVIDPSGLALTNWHVVSAALEGGVPRSDHRVEVTLPTGERYVANVLSTSRDDDLALIALQLEPGRTLEPVELGDSDALAVGQPVIAIGNPLGLANSVSVGIVSCRSLDVRIQGRLREYKGMVMVDAAINPGNSGGALLDEGARLVGINSAGRVGAGMAIPVNKAREVFADKLLAAENLRSSFLGFEVSEERGALVVRAVDELGPAGRVGVEPGDELLAIDERAGLSRIALAQVLLEARPGTPLRLRLGRGGEVLERVVIPIPYAAWLAFRQSGALVEPLDYAREVELVHAASIALHRAYTGSESGQPARLMGGALRIVGVRPVELHRDHPLRVGDLLLGVTTVTRGETSDSHDLLRLESLDDLAEALEPRATKEGERCEVWIYREGEVLTADLLVRRPPPR